MTYVTGRRGGGVGHAGGGEFRAGQDSRPG